MFKLHTLDLKVLDIQNDKYIYTDMAKGEGMESVVKMINRLSKKTRKALKERDEQILAKSEKVDDIITSNLEAYMHFCRGEEFYDTRDFDDAAAEFKKSIKLDSTFGLAYFMLTLIEVSESEASAERVEGLIRKTFTLIHRLPEKERRFLFTIKERQEKGWEAGIAKLIEMEQIYPDYKEMVCKIGEWYHQARQFEKAEEYYKKVLALDPTHNAALEYLTWTYEERGLYEQELETAKRYVATVQGGHHANAYYELAKAFVLTGRFEEGLKTLKEYRDLFPENYVITQWIAELYAHQEKYTEAESELKLLIEEENPAPAKEVGYLGLRRIYSYTGKYRDALKTNDQIIEYGWQHNDTTLVAKAILLKGLLLVWGWNDLENAIKETNRITLFMDKVSDRTVVWFLAILQVYNGDYASAEKTIKLAGSVVQISIRSLMQMKRDCDIVNSYPDDYYLEGYYNPVQIFLLYHIAECQIKIGQLDEAFISIKRLQEEFEVYWIRAVFYPKSFYLLGKLYEKKGNTEQAIKTYEKLFKLWKDADKDLPDLIDAKARYEKMIGEK